MAEEHQPQVPAALEQILGGLSELEVVLGEAARGVLPAVRARLGEAVAARDRGDPVASLAAVGEAMDRLAELAGRLDPAEAVLMRSVSDHFRRALMGGDEAAARGDMRVMFDRSGAKERGNP